MYTKMDWDLNYGELATDEDFVNNCEELKENLMNLQKVLDQLLPLKRKYDVMPLVAQIELDLFLAFTLSSLHWVHLRIKGVDPTTSPIKDELQRIQKTMGVWQEMKRRGDRPKLNKQAAKRFIRSGLYDPYKGTAQIPNKKIKSTD